MLILLLLVPLTYIVLAPRAQAASSNLNPAIPPPVPAAGPVLAGIARNITAADNGKEVTLKAGQRFLLFLGSSYNWQVTVTNRDVVQRVRNVLVIPGAQGLYQTRGRGVTLLTATGEASRAGSTSPAVAEARVFRVWITVR